jgi:hypothetical protein
MPVKLDPVQEVQLVVLSDTAPRASSEFVPQFAVHVNSSTTATQDTPATEPSVTVTEVAPPVPVML